MRVELQRALTAWRTLTGCLLEGHYSEQRLLGQEHRALVLLGPDEGELGRRLEQLAAKVRRAGPELHVGLERTERGIAIYALLGALPLGCHWFRIIAIDLVGSSVLFRLESLRYLPDKELPKEDSAKCDAAGPSPLDCFDSFSQNSKSIFENFNSSTAMHSFKFLFIILLSLLTGLLKAVQFVGEFTIKFMHESANLIDKSTPLFFGVLNFMSKLASAFFISMTMLFRGNKPIRVQNFEAIDDGRYKRDRRNQTFD